MLCNKTPHTSVISTEGTVADRLVHNGMPAVTVSTYCQELIKTELNLTCRYVTFVRRSVYLPVHLI